MQPVGLVLRPSGLVCLWFCVFAGFFIPPRSGGAFAFGVVGVCRYCGCAACTFVFRFLWYLWFTTGALNTLYT